MSYWRHTDNSPSSIKLPLPNNTGYSFLSASMRVVNLDITSGRSCNNEINCVACHPLQVRLTYYNLYAHNTTIGNAMLSNTWKYVIFRKPSASHWVQKFPVDLYKPSNEVLFCGSISVTISKSNALAGNEVRCSFRATILKLSACTTIIPKHWSIRTMTNWNQSLKNSTNPSYQYDKIEYKK